jgi:hypothetical protein
MMHDLYAWHVFRSKKIFKAKLFNITRLTLINKVHKNEINYEQYK